MLPSLMHSFVGQSSIRELCPPALLLLEGERTEGRKKREKFYIYSDVTHTQHGHTQLFDPTCLAPSLFLPAFPISFSHLLGDHWKKLTCWVIRSFHCCCCGCVQCGAVECPKVVRTWCALHMLTSKGASRHNSVHFFNISTSKSGPVMV